MMMAEQNRMTNTVQSGSQTADPPVVYPSSMVGSAAGWPLVLYFHHVNPDINHYTSLTPKDFDRALALVSEQFGALSPQDVPSVDRNFITTDGPQCLLTFDDGYQDVFDYALPIMERRGFRAIIFASVDQIGTIEEHPVRGRLLHMGWEQLTELIARGHVVANHGASHRPYDQLSQAEAQADLDHAWEQLQSRLPGARDWFAYPYGATPRETLRLPTFCFGSVKAQPMAWDDAPHEIRRTYLPADQKHNWEAHIDAWRQTCISR